MTTTTATSTTSTTLPPGIPVAAIKVTVVDRGPSGAKVTFVSRDPAITKGAGTSTATIGISFDFTYDNGTDPPPAGQFTAPLGSPHWIVNSENTAKYVNHDAPAGGGTRVAVVKPNKLAKLLGRNLGDTPIDIFDENAVPTGVATTAYCVDNDGETNCFCSTFTTCTWRSIAGGTGAKVVCRMGTGDATCAAMP